MASAFFSAARVVVRGGGDLGSGAIYRLHRAGFPVIILELPAPLLVRRAVAFGDAAVSGVRTVEGVTARRIDSIDHVDAVLAAGEIPLLVDPAGGSLAALKPVILLDARMDKRNLGTTIHDAPLVVALGPGFTAGSDCHAVVETNRGHALGRVLYAGSAEADSGEPGSVRGQTHSRILRAPADGHVQPCAAIGDTVAEGQVIARVSGLPVTAAFAGVLRGLVHESACVTVGLKIGDLDPRAKREHCFTISDKALAVGGGVLEAAFSSQAVRDTFLRETSP